ncbi:MAG: hypothetical protein ACP6IS_11645 [Candidatus Asgardarchaeia archaeon]
MGEKGFKMEWSKVHKHGDGTIGRDTVIRDYLGRPAVSEVKGETFKTVIEKIDFDDGTVYIEKDLTGVVRGWSIKRK